ncbi:DUF2231 domain-containing protein [Thiomicrorhabdus sp. 6S2-11]|uniref:DUF2231 domain-containing protein n=1 Tax=Thiomicrorhabdus marina TaxID=2818442 RepID=A0ABS3Q4G1_9GAMM|nr:DUF2231 domain-containing protein [Thiomicrorhabdus marina]MBO1927230.1 DUF2231 domain-containing protein [Thiomicrorhabdus marina]
MRHPLHPALVHFPIACWTLAVLADFASLHFGEAAWRWSAGLLAVGCGMALLAMLAGLLELPKVPEGSPLRDTYWHMSLMLAAFMLFSIRLLLGQEQFQPIAPNLALLCVDVMGLICLIAGGWLGGRLVYGHDIGRT